VRLFLQPLLLHMEIHWLEVGQDRGHRRTMHFPKVDPLVVWNGNKDDVEGTFVKVKLLMLIEHNVW
jgi:hypothetical protein